MYVETTSSCENKILSSVLKYNNVTNYVHKTFWGLKYNIPPQCSAENKHLLF